MRLRCKARVVGEFLRARLTLGRFICPRAAERPVGNLKRIELGLRHHLAMHAATRQHLALGSELQRDNQAGSSCRVAPQRYLTPIGHRGDICDEETCSHDNPVNPW